MKHPLLLLAFSIPLVLLAALPVSFGAKDLGAPGALLIALAAAACFMGIPLLYILLRRENPASYGLRLPNPASRPWFLTAAVVLLQVPFLAAMAELPSFRDYYGIPGGIGGFLLAAVLSTIVYYLAEEFLFRGFLLFPLWERYRWFGAGALLLVFSLFHAGKPSPEFEFSLLAGAALAWLALRTRSFLPAAVAHWAIAFIVNLLVFMAAGPSAQPFSF